MAIATGIDLKWLPRFTSWAKMRGKERGCQVLFYWRHRFFLQYEEWTTRGKNGQRGFSKGQTKEIKDFMRAYPAICCLWGSFSFVLKFCPSILAGKFGQAEIVCKLRNFRIADKKKRKEARTPRRSRREEIGDKLMGLSKLGNTKNASTPPSQTVTIQTSRSSRNRGLISPNFQGGDDVGGGC